MSGVLPAVLRHAGGAARIALRDHRRAAFSYADLVAAAAGVADAHLAGLQRETRPDGTVVAPRVAYLAPRDNTYVVSQFATWLAGATAVPLPEGYPTAELRYFLEDAAPSVALVHPSQRAHVEAAAQGLPLKLIELPDTFQAGAGAAAATAARLAASSATAAVATDPESGAYIVYTSGTTGRPKGVLTSHRALTTQVEALTQAWEWAPTDKILHVLPLHHVHGIMAVGLCAWYNGAEVDMHKKADPAAIWAALTTDPSLTLFMAVPTVYARLIQHYDAQSADTQAAWKAALRGSHIRLMVSGSAALPEPVMRRWLDLTGHVLLERFGMSEFGMAVSNPYRPPVGAPVGLNGSGRIPGCVGKPLPGYSVRIVPEDDARGEDAGRCPPGEPGELQVTGSGLFSEYWNRPAATSEAFAPGGRWFKTGDCAVSDASGNISILGRLSADIIKTGGYKVSALDVERVLLDHPDVVECAVVGLPDDVYGERIAAVIAPKPGGGAGAGGDTAALAAAWTTSFAPWLKGQLPGYKTPSLLLSVPEIPRNAMGKVNKKALKASIAKGELGTPAKVH